MKYIISCFIITFLITGLVSAQSNKDSSKISKSGFFKIQKEYQEYAKTQKPNYKGSKQFKRWEWFYESRVNDDGKFPSKTFWNELKKVDQLKTQKSKSWSNWEPLGPFEIPLDLNTGYRTGVGRVNCIEFHPDDPNTFWIGAPVGGVWKTNDHGTTWSTTTDELNSIGISDIVVNPLNPEILYIATGDKDGPDIFSVGILKSYDGGENWHQTGLNFDIPDLTNVCDILIDPADTNVLVAATSVGIYKTTDSGENWNLVSPVFNFKDMIHQHGNYHIMLASTYDRFDGNTKIFRSEDAGDTWVELTEFSAFLGNASRTAFATSKNDPNTLYAVSCKSGNAVFQGFYKSSDAGISWTKISDSSTPDIVGYQYSGMQGSGQGWFDLSIEVSPLNSNEILVGGTHMWRSTDGGNNWDLIQEYYPSPTWIHVDFHEFRYHPANDRLYAGCDGGIYFSEDFGTNWTDLSAGLQILQSYRIGTSFQIEDFIVMGNQDNGSMRLLDGTVAGTTGSDGTECIIDYSSPNIVYSSYIFGRFFRSDNYGDSWINISPPGQSGAWLTPLIIHPNNPETIYAGYNAIWKSDDRGNYGTWERISDYFPGNLHRIDVAASNDKVIYASTLYDIWKTVDGGQSWINIESNLPNGFYTDIEVSPVDENMIWICLGRYDESHKVYKSTNGGLSWENMSLNLPNLHGVCLLYDKNTCDGIYFGNETGVYYINNSLDEWIPLNNNLPNVIVADLEIQSEFNSIIAGTYGRGLWKSNTFYTDEIPVADFEIDDTYECSGTFFFTNTTTGYFDSVYWDFGNNNYSQHLNASNIYTEPGAYEVTLSVYQNNIEYQVSENISIEQIAEIPEVTDGEICGPGEVTLYASGSDQIYWFENDWSGEIIYEGNEFTTPYLSDTSTYYAANGADESCLSQLVPVLANILETPEASFEFDINSDHVNFYNQSSNSLEYLWNFGDGNESTEENPVHYYDNPGNYEVELMAYNSNCTDTATRLIVLVLNNDLAGDNMFRIFPNPSNGNITIELKETPNTSLKIKLFDLSGKLIWNHESFVKNKEAGFQLPKNLNGSYLLKVIYNKQTFTSKIDILK